MINEAESLTGRIREADDRCESICHYRVGERHPIFIGSYTCKHECEFNKGTTHTPGRVHVQCSFKASPAGGGS